MKAEAARVMTPDQRDDEVAKLRKEQFNLRFQRATGQLENTARVRQVRRDIARLLTISAEPHEPRAAKAPARPRARKSAAAKEAAPAALEAPAKAPKKRAPAKAAAKETKKPAAKTRGKAKAKE